MRYTKIVCTIGPASRDPEILSQLIEAGMNVARINFSHGDHATHAESIRAIRAIAEEHNHPVAILADLQGPKLRVGALPQGGVELEPGNKIQITTREDSQDQIPCQYEDLPRLVGPGDRMLLDDGLLELEVVETSAETIKARVITGGTLHSNKGINLPRADTRIPAITDKDREDLQFAVAHQMDWVALSFVRTADEVLELKGLIRKESPSGQLPQVVAKIEKPEAVHNIREIIRAADGIMVARGDLGIELPTEDVPMIQKEIIRLCNEAGKPVITATQMLDSMIRNPRPTRAEASDVANAVLDGTDAVMLSGETAAGRYPVRAVQVMDRIVRTAEQALPSKDRRPKTLARINFAAQAIAHAASNLATELGAAAIIAPTTSGYTARQLSRYRPGIPVVAVTPNQMVRRQLNLHWGVYPLYSSRRPTTDEVMEDAVQVALAAGLVREGDLVVLTAGSAGSTPGTTNLIKIRLIEHVLATGQGIGDQKVRGRVRKLKPPLPAGLKIEPTDIVVAESFDSSWQRLINPAGGLVAEEGSRQSVAVRLAEELKIPAVVGATGSFSQFSDGALVVLDPARGIVYRGVGLDDVRSAESKFSGLRAQSEGADGIGPDSMRLDDIRPGGPR